MSIEDVHIQCIDEVAVVYIAAFIMVHFVLNLFESAGGAYVGFVHGSVVLVSLFGSPWGWVS